ncbi:MAG: helix-turn-helix domain-containing protein [Pseudomonadota bacterium]
MSSQQPRQRAVQQRAEDTKEAILAAAVELFSTRGFDGVSIRAIEGASGTKRGLVNYHFSDKEGLWRAVVDRVFDDGWGEDERSRALQDLDHEAQIRAQLTEFVRYSALRPELSRLIIQEGKARTWRLEYMVSHYVRPRLASFERLLGHSVDAHTLYAFLGAATLVFDVEAECESLFGFNPRGEAFIEEHARRVCNMVLATLRAARSEGGAQAEDA